MQAGIARFFEQLRGKRVWFVGIGVSHAQAILMFARKGIAVSACDRRSREQIGEEQCREMEAAGVNLLLGDHYPKSFRRADILLRTPGMYYNSPELVEYRRGGGILTSEMELFFELCPCPVIAVTGSDGKTTTTTLIAEMLKAQGYTVYLGGNIGRALLPLVEQITPQDYAVVELSSFQLISMRCAPQVSVVTNVSPNHLDVHADLAEYIQTKQHIYRHQNAFSRTVLNLDNAITASFAEEVRGDCMWFSLQKSVSNGAWLQDGTIRFLCHGDGTPRHILDMSDIRIPGIHNVANYLAAICAVQGLVDAQSVRRVAREFGGVEHRIEFVRECRGVKWYNDSIATTPTRSMAGLRAFDRKIIMIAGGYDKKIPFEPLAPEIAAHVKTLILTGSTADKIEEAVKADSDYMPGAPNILRAGNLEEAVRIADREAGKGDVVSLSPACASFDVYANFEARGRHFKELVHQLEA